MHYGCKKFAFHFHHKTYEQACNLPFKRMPSLKPRHNHFASRHSISTILNHGMTSETIILSVRQQNKDMKSKREQEVSTLSVFRGTLITINAIISTHYLLVFVPPSLCFVFSELFPAANTTS